MEIARNIFVAICTLIVVFGVYMIFRNNWVFRTKQEFARKISVYTEKCINEWSENNCVPSHENLHKFLIRCYTCQWSYNKMLLSFWVWEPSKMVEDRQMYDAIVNQTINYFIHLWNYPRSS